MIKREILLLFLYFSIVSCIGFDSTICGKTKHCVSIPSNCHEHNNEECDFIFGHSPSADGKAVEIEVYGKRKGTAGPVDYVAAGFSEDERMGNDPVSACVVSDDGAPHLQLSYNPGTWNEKVNFTEQNAQLLDSAATDDYIYCKFLQSKDPGGNQFPDFDKSYQILAARGPRSPAGALAIHNAAQSIPDPVDLTLPVPAEDQEPQEIDISDPAITGTPPGPPLDPNPNESDSNDVQPEEPPKTVTVPVQRGTGPFSLTGATKVFLVRLHGLFMLIGWFGMVAIAIFSARYLRSALPHSKIRGVHVWFHLHRAINVAAVILIIVAALLILVGKDLEWTGPRADAPSEYNLGPGAMHSIIGLVAVVIAFLQPFGSLLRCGPDHPRRPIFNWFHRIFGILGIILAFVAAFIAILKFVSLWSDTTWPLVIFIIYIVLAILLVAGLEIYEILRIKRRQKFAVSTVELQGRGKYYDASEVNYRSRIYEKEAKDKFFTIIFYFIFATASIAAVVLLALFLI